MSIAPNYIVEGASFDLVATATSAAVRPITVNVTLRSSENNNFLATASRGPQTIDIQAGATKGLISIISQADGVAGNKGLIYAQLNAGSGYSLPEAAGDQLVLLTVLESLPEVSISAPTQVKEDVGRLPLR